MKHDKPSRNLIAAGVRGSALLGACALSAPAHALDWYFGDFEYNLDTSIIYSAAWRTSDPDTEISEGNINANDGDNNFDKNSMINNNIKIILETGGVYKGFSFFLRGDAFYDHVYHQRSDMSAEHYGTYNVGFPVGGDVARGDFTDDTVDENGQRARILDAFITYQFNVGDNMGGGLRLGRQVISWGEASYYSGVNALQNPLDVVARTTPGSEVKEYLLPTNAIDLKWDFNEFWSAEAYYKLEWQRSTLAGVGSYWSTTDLNGPGAQRILFPDDNTPPGASDRQALRGETITPGASDHQYGIALRYVTPALGGASFDFYYVEANGNFPGVKTVVPFVGNGVYQEIYATGIENWGFSTSTNIGEALVYLDTVYSPNMPLVDSSQNIDFENQVATVADVTRAHLWQTVIGYTDVYTAFPWLTEQLALIAEVIYTHNNLGENGDTKGQKYNATDESWGYQLIFNAAYYKVIQGMDMNVNLAWIHALNGLGNGLGYQGLTRESKVMALGATANYLTNWEFTARYSWMFGGDEKNVTGDRDNIAINVKYKF